MSEFLHQSTPERVRPILVVDDEQMLRDLISVALSDYDITTACDGCEAAKLIGQRDFDLVITDLMMPRGDGFTVLRAARECTLPPAVLVLTGYPSTENERLCRELGCSEIMAKPFQVATLRDRVTQCLRTLPGRSTSDTDPTTAGRKPA